MPKRPVSRRKLPVLVWDGKKSDPSDSQAEGRGFEPRLPLQCLLCDSSRLYRYLLEQGLSSSFCYD